MAYTLNGKIYELKYEDTSKTIWPKMHVMLVSEDGDEIEVYYHDCDQVDGNPEATYAGGGMYYKDNSGEKITPNDAAAKEADYTAEWAIDRMNAPETGGIYLRQQIEQAAQELLRSAYYDLYSRTFAEYADARLAEEKEAAE